MLGLYFCSAKQQNRGGSTVEYYALAENVWNKAKHRSETKVIHSFGRPDSLDRDVLERLAHSIRRVQIDSGIDRAFDLGVAQAVWQKLGIG